MSKHEMKCYIIAGPNGAGKTTFAENFLPEEAGCLNFLNADLIARGISPFNPENVIMRRFHRGWANFQKHYKHIVDDWVVFDNSGDIPLILEEKT
jgi:predicted ABC-type ATPase